MNKRIIAFLIICTIIISFSISVFSVEIEDENNVETQEEDNGTENKTLQEQKAEIDARIENTNTQLEYVQSEMGSTLQKVLELQDTQDKYESQYNQLQQQISDLSNRINTTNQRLQEIQERYDKKDKILKKKVVALYESGDTTYLDLLLSSKNIIEFISNYFLMSELIEYDNNLLDEMEDTQKQIERTKAEQVEQENSLRVSREEIVKTQILIENTKKIQQNYAMKLTSKEREIQEQIEKYKEEQAEIERQIAAAINWGGTFSIQYTDGAMIWPVAMEGTYVTSPFGGRIHPIQGVYKNHAGMDISGPGIYGAPVVAAAEGIVIYADVMGGYGNCVMVSHGNGIVSLYGHGSEIIAQLGQTVKQGDIIMKVGSTGNSTGPHLHFEIRKDGVATDPVPYLNGEIKSLNEMQNEQTENTTQDNLNNNENSNNIQNGTVN